MLWNIEGLTPVETVAPPKRPRLGLKLKYYKALVDFSNDAIIEKNLNGTILNWNKAAAKIYGYKRAEIIGKNIQVMIPEDKKDEFLRLLTAVENGKSISGFETARLKKDGTRMDVSLTMVPIKDRGRITSVLVISRNISDRKLSEEKDRLFVEIGKKLYSSLDYKTTLHHIANLVVSYLAEWCVIDLLDSSGKIERVIIVNTDPKKAVWARRLIDRFPKLLAPKLNTKVIKKGETIFYPNVTGSLLKKRVKNNLVVRILKKLKLGAVITVPIVFRKKIMGQIILVSGKGKIYAQKDLLLAEELGRKAGLAIDNALAYQKLQKEVLRRRKIEKSLESEQNKVVDVIANVPGVVWEMYKRPNQKQNRINYVSPYIEKMTGYKMKRWITEPDFWLTIAHPEDRVMAEKLAEEQYGSGSGGVNLYRWIRKDGRVIWAEAYSSVIKNKSGKPMGSRGVTMDVTPRMEFEKRRDEFFGMISHELNTPVTTIKMFIQILQNLSGLDIGRLNKYLGRMETQVDRVIRLIKELLDIANIEKGKITFAKTSFSFDELVRETVENFQAIPSNHKIMILGRTDKNVRADRDRIGQVIINLISNAIKYSPGKGLIEVKLATRNRHVLCKVKDFGIGISKADCGKVFEKFYRIENAASPYPGLGIGLYLSKEIILRHSGIIQVKSIERKGSVFSFNLPYA